MRADGDVWEETGDDEGEIMWEVEVDLVQRNEGAGGDVWEMHKDE